MSKKKEIEIKLAVSDNKFLEIMRVVKESGAFIERSIQKDTYYTPAHRNFMKEKYPFEWLSIRERNDQCIFNYKHFHPEGAEKHEYCDEYEVVVGNAELFGLMLKAMDFKKIAIVAKERESYKHLDKYEISFDVVKDLGHFIEIELIEDVEDVQSEREKMMKLIEGWGLSGADIDLRGYPFLVFEKNL